MAQTAPMAHIEAPMAQVRAPMAPIDNNVRYDYAGISAVSGSETNVRMSKNLVPTQSQAQAQSFVDLTEPQEELIFLGKLEISLVDQLV